MAGSMPATFGRATAPARPSARPDRNLTAGRALADPATAGAGARRASLPTATPGRGSRRRVSCAGATCAAGALRALPTGRKINNTRLDPLGFALSVPVRVSEQLNRAEERRADFCQCGFLLGRRENNVQVFVTAEHQREDSPDFFGDTTVRAKLGSQAECDADARRIAVADSREIGGFDALVAPKKLCQAFL